MRLKAPVLILISSLLVLLSQAQSGELIVQGKTGNLYLEHTVVAKETWYSVGRLYNINPKTLATFNHLTFANPLTIGQVVRVPLTAENFSQDGKKLAAETLVPVMHVVQDKEWLYRISVNHNKVPIPTLEKWNHITGAQVVPGLHMIVGYLKVKTALSALARGGGPAGTGGVAPVTPPAVTGAGSGTSGTAAKATGTPEAGATGAAGTNGTPVKAVEEKTTPAGTTDSPATVAAAAPAPVVKAPAVTHPVSNSKEAPHFNGGQFRTDFSDGGRSLTGQAGIFKSNSGWQDGKYYALINNVPVGTIVKITDPNTGKSIYAKVLGQLPDMKESEGLTVRLSNAAAAELGEGEGKFGVGVNY